MDYFNILELQREPFSNSPDPDFFYRSVQHTGCLQHLELAIRLRRGLNVVIGDVGTGKTTLCRELIRRFDSEGGIATFLLLDPGSDSESHFLSAVVEQFSGGMPPAHWTDQQKKETIKKFLFEKGVEEGRTTVLIIDEGQKITPPCLEILREFLNYETNAYKLLQIVIFAQKEFERTVADHPNFADRINLRLDLQPLSFRDSLSLIHYRIQASGGGSAKRLFTLPAMAAIFMATRGYPRRIIHLCHRVLLSLIIQNRPRANWRLVRASARRAMGPPSTTRWRWRATTVAVALIALFAITPHQRLLEPLNDFGLNARTTAVSEPSSTSAALDSLPQTARRDRTLEAPSQALHTAPQISETPYVGLTPAFASERTTSAPMAAPPASVARPMPARLGRLAIAPQETLGQLIQTIYGRFTPGYLDAIAEANPHIPNPNRLNVGDVIHFPALPAEVRPLPVPVWWIQLDDYPQLDQAISELKQTQREGIAARLIPYWNHEEGLVFALVLKGCFYDRQVAENTLIHTLPTADQTKAAVRSLWRDDTVFFSNPFRTEAETTAAHF
jgi:general secretion pathway protein A